MACLRVRGSVEMLLTAKAQPVPRPQMGLSLRDRKVSSADATRERNGYSPRERRKGSRGAGMSSCCACHGGATVSVTLCGEAVAGVRSVECCGGGGGDGTALGSAVLGRADRLRVRANPSQHSTWNRPLSEGANDVGNVGWIATASQERVRARPEATCTSEWERPSRTEET
eukprot:4376881-Pleurochrysis_carterae.AAC.3